MINIIIFLPKNACNDYYLAYVNIEMLDRQFMLHSKIYSSTSHLNLTYSKYLFGSFCI